MIWFSVYFAVVEPISAVMLAAIVLWYRDSTILGLWVRICTALLAAGLILHAIGSVFIIADYRAPRTVAWVPVHISVNLLIWTFFISEARSRFRGWRHIFWDFHDFEAFVRSARGKHEEKTK